MPFSDVDPELLKAWARAFALTQVIEVPIYTAIAWKKAPLPRLIAAAFACTAVTHPLLWFVWPHVVTDYTAFVVSGELLIAVGESLLFFALIPRLDLPRAIGAAFVANATSYGMGQLLRAVGLFS